MNVDPQRLRAFMLDADLITKAQFDKALKKAKKTKTKVEDMGRIKSG
ncbi:MAG: hypothetical protein IIB08_00680 [Bacteroidetes bacterium]|nr:hypothetical protein [Bacteroidota bacterium]